MMIERVGGAVLYNADCRDVYPLLENVDAIFTDPPYYKIKDDAWDRQWKTKADFLDWLEANVTEWQRILAINGSLYCFCYPSLAAKTEVMIGKYFNVLNHIVLVKTNNSRANLACKEALRTYFPDTERCIFAEHYGSNKAARGECDTLRGFVFAPLRAYLSSEWERAGMTPKDAVNICGSVARHYFGLSQWELPTRENYEKLRAAANQAVLQREYEDLRREYEDLQRPFAGSKEKYYTDIWHYKSIPSNKGYRIHPAQKPLPIMRHIVHTSSRAGAVVFDPFMGSGTTGEAALELERQFIGVEKDEQYFDAAVKRLRQVANQGKLLPLAM